MSREFPLIFTIVFSTLSLILSGYIVIVLVKHSTNRFYHLWNRVAAVLFACLCINNIFRATLQVHDLATQHGAISDVMCYATFATNEFLTSAVEIFYIIFLLIISVPKFAEPVTRPGIEWAVVPCVTAALGWACLATAIPLFVGTPLEHRRSWCWVKTETAALKFIFIYVTAAVSVVVSGGFVLWVVDQEVRVRKWRILTFGVTQLLVVSIYAIFVFTEVASPIPAGSPAFDAFGLWMAMHDTIRAVTFIIAEKLYPPRNFFPDLWKCGGGDDSISCCCCSWCCSCTSKNNNTKKSNDDNEKSGVSRRSIQQTPAQSNLELTPSEAERRSRTNTSNDPQIVSTGNESENAGLLLGDGGNNNNNQNNSDSDNEDHYRNNSKNMNRSRQQQYPSNGGGSANPTRNNSRLQQNATGPSNTSFAFSGNGAAAAAFDDLTEGDTLTYFIRVLQRHYVAGGLSFDDGPSGGGGRGGTSGTGNSQNGRRRNQARKQQRRNQNGYGTAGEDNNNNNNNNNYAYANGGDGYDGDEVSEEDEDESAYGGAGGGLGGGAESSEDEQSAYAGGRGASFMRFGSQATSNGGGGNYQQQDRQQGNDNNHLAD